MSDVDVAVQHLSRGRPGRGLHTATARPAGHAHPRRLCPRGRRGLGGPHGTRRHRSRRLPPSLNDRVIHRLASYPQFHSGRSCGAWPRALASAPCRVFVVTPLFVVGSVDLGHRHAPASRRWPSSRSPSRASPRCWPGTAGRRWQPVGPGPAPRIGPGGSAASARSTAVRHHRRGGRRSGPPSGAGPVAGRCPGRRRHRRGRRRATRHRPSVAQPGPQGQRRRADRGRRSPAPAGHLVGRRLFGLVAGRPGQPEHGHPGQLETLPGVGPVLAQRILDYRDQHGGFTSIDQLRQVSGIGDAKFNDLRNRVTV